MRVDVVDSAGPSGAFDSPTGVTPGNVAHRFSLLPSALNSASKVRQREVRWAGCSREHNVTYSEWLVVEHEDSNDVVNKLEQSWFRRLGCKL